MVEAVRLTDITKRFPGVIANDRVNLSVQKGQIHSVCGENGAGKSVLMKTLYGMHAPDEGEMYCNGEQVHFHSPKDAIERGIGMVHQHFMLAENLTVLENIILGEEPGGALSIDFADAREEVSKLCKSYGLEIDLNEITENLSVGQRQRVEIVKVLYRGAEILILDEPTAVLVPQEVEELFKSLRDLKSGGKTIIFIDHKLDEVMEISDEITVIRAGKTIGTVKPAETTPRDLAEMMIGSSLPTPNTESTAIRQERVLEVQNLEVEDEGKKLVRGVSFHLNAGEILGLAGVEGNGQVEIIQSILGLLPASSGNIEMNGVSVIDLPIKTRREMGMGYIPEDRLRRGILSSAPLWENTILGHQEQEPYSFKKFWMNIKGSKKRTEQVVKDFDVRTPGINVPIYALSGGNQQKLVIGREMITDLELLLAAHPTRGIDVGAQAAIWEDLRNAKSEGLGILLISADLEELIGLSDRILVVLRGEITAELDPSKTNPRELGSYMTGAHKEEAARAE